MLEPLLTIVTINRNHAAGLARTVESFRRLRDDPCVQFVFIDGASTDDSLAVASTFYLPEEIVSEPDAGIYDAMNKGLGLAVGKYVIWINTGDELHPHAWPQVVQLLQTSNAALIACGWEYLPAEPSQLSRICFSKVADFPESLFCHQAVFFSRTKALEYGGYSLVYSIVSDRALVLRIYLASEQIEYNSLLIARVEHGGVSSNNFLRELDNYRVDRDLGLITGRQYSLGVIRHQLFHRFVYPLWVVLSRISSKAGLASLPKPSWIKSLLGQPVRSRMFNLLNVK